ncbi:MAG: dephospho-CoA kinase [Eubacteriales bacterium]|nr:dephospho-CoA kinase [Eubacteriales bacterium]
MKVIGITGGIGCGKSAVSEYIAAKGYYVIDADAISHELTKPGSETVDALEEAFGSEIIDKSGLLPALDRKKMADIVFHDPEKKERLESIVTERVIAEVRRRIARKKTDDRCKVVFLDAPTLFETGAEVLCDSVWVVTADMAVRLARIADRDGASEADARARMANQMSEEQKCKRADVVIENNGTMDELQAEIDKLLARI